MNTYPFDRDDEQDDQDKFFEEFAKSKDEDEKKLMKILDNLVEEMNSAEEYQAALKQDYRSQKYEKLDVNSQKLIDWHYLRVHSN